MQERNISLDYFKLLLALLVITIHLRPYSDSAKNFIGDGIARIAVPCFFVINGYFLASIINNKHKFSSYIKKLTTVYIVWMIVYSGFYIERFFDINSVSDFFEKSIILLTGYWHIWYIAALIMSSLLLYNIKNFNKYALLALSFTLFLFGYFIHLLQIIDVSHLSRPIQQSLSFLYLHKIELIRNFLFMGFPFFFLGYFIKTKENTAFHLKKNVHILLLGLCFVAFLIESHLFTLQTKYLFAVSDDYRLAMFFLCPLLVSFIINHPTIRIDDGYYSKLATAIYFIHPLVIHTLPIKLTNYKYIFIILLISVLYSTVLIHINKKLKIFF